ncbi:MAG: hypothetical protein ABSG68_05385 [Thermoguttaceae bacterium]|jgi:hypothetical protein
MKLVRIFLIASLVAWVPIAAQAQLGLYGSPETLQLVAPPAQSPLYAGVAASSYEATSLPPVSPAPAPVSPSQAATTPAACAAPYAAPVYAGPAASTGCDGNQGFLSSNYYARPQEGETAGACQNPLCPWYVTTMALYMGRNKPDSRLWTSAENDHHFDTNQLTNTADIPLDWQAGGEIRIGRQFCCNQWAIEADYWTLSPFDGFLATKDANGLVSPLTNGWTFDKNNVGFNEYFDHANEHDLWRHDEIHSLELNVIRNHLCGCGCAPWNLDASLGVRYFRFRERLIYGSDSLGMGSCAYLNDEVANNLIGLQFGFNGEYCLNERLKVFVTPKFGLYDNVMNQSFNAYTGNCSNEAHSGLYGNNYPINSNKNGFAFLTQVDVGLNWQVCQHIEALAGYRVVAMTGMALADNQFPQITGDVPALGDIQHNGSLILHGAFAGLTFRF